MSEFNDSVYFAPLLPWQTDSWAQLTARYERLPHGLLFAGMQGIGKRAFVWRYVAWLLCDNRQGSATVACGHCQSCQWLLAGTHPDLRVLPQSSLPMIDTNNEDESKGKKKAKKEDNKVAKTETIKVDDIRELQPFIGQGSTGNRVCVIDNADMMTVAAANALLKTLEEPRQGVYLFLISDVPTKLLPTIRSRVQKVAIDQISSSGVHAYLVNYIKNQRQASATNEGKEDTNNAPSHSLFSNIENSSVPLDTHINQALKLASGAPLAALDILSSQWYQHRELWLKTWEALRTGRRTSIAASDYWQTLLSLDELIILSETIIMDMSRYSLGMHPVQTDLNLENYQSIKQLYQTDIESVWSLIADIKLSRQQNVQDKLGYDRLMASLERL